MKTKLFTLFLALMTSAGAIFASDIQVDGIWYNFNSESQTAEVTYHGSSYKQYSDEYTGSVVIPSYVTYDNVNYSVTSIGNQAFDLCSGLTSVTIPNSVTSIGAFAFYGCTGLTSVTIPNSVTSIGNWAFAYCSGLTSVTIGNGVTSIGNYAFRECSGLTSIEIPNSVTSIGNDAFTGCSGLTSVTIGNGVTSIGNYAFRECSGLTSIVVETGNTMYDSRNNCNALIETSTNALIIGCMNTIIPNSVASIGSSAFAYCSGLTSVTIPNSVTSIGAFAFRECSGLTSVTIGNGVTSIGDWAFRECSGLTSVTIGNGVTSIGDWAFNGCSGLTSIEIPNSVTSIGDWAFNGCSGLTNIEVLNETPFTITSNVFSSTPLSSIYVPCRSKEAYRVAWSSYASLIMPLVYSFEGSVNSDIMGYLNIQNDTCEVIASAKSNYGYHFAQWSDGNTDNPRTIELSQDTTFTAEFAIDRSGKCGNDLALTWTYDTISKTLTISGNGAFVQNIQCGVEARPILEKVIIGEGVTAIKSNAFADCPHLTSVTLDSNPIASKAYTWIPSQEDSTNPKNVFGSQVTELIIGNNVTSIGELVFSKYTSLTSITISRNVTSIGNGAFYGCSNITSVHWNAKNCNAYNFGSQVQSFTFGDSVKAIPASLCSGMNKLSVIAIPNSVTSIGTDAFQNCTSLTSVTIPNTVTNIEQNTFSGCSGLTSIEIPSSVTSIGNNAFSGCSNITSVIWNAKNCNGWNFGDQVESFTFGDSVEVIPANCCKDMNKLTTITIPQSVTSIGDHAFNGCGGKIASLVFPASLNSIGEYAFKGWTKIKQINIPNEVETIGAHAFDSCIFVTSIYLGNAVSEIGDYAFKGCIRVNDITSMNTTTPVVYDNTLTSISPYAYLFVQAGSKRTYQLDPYWSRFDIREIASEETTVTKDAVTVEANEDNAIFTWPVDDNAASYSLQITKDGVVFCVLTFNANGQLIGIAFAPGRDGQAHAPAATTSLAGMSFTVTGLNGASKYAYRLAASDAQDNEIVAYSGEFATTGYEGEVNPGGEPENPFEDVENVSANLEGSHKILRNGQILILRGDKVYTITGQVVK